MEKAKLARIYFTLIILLAHHCYLLTFHTHVIDNKNKLQALN